MKVFFIVAALMVFTPLSVFGQAGSEKSKNKPVTEELLEMEKRFEKQAPPDLLEAGRKGNEEISESGVVDSALKVGDSMPGFELKDAYDKVHSSASLLEEGPIILVFYRGAWCPYCNLYLRGLQRRLADFEERGAQLVAISVEPPDRSLKVVKDNKLDFTVLSDPGLETARKFGIVYELPQVVDSAVKKRGLDIAKYNGQENAELPISATYVVSKRGKIEYAFLDADYKKRGSPDDIIKVLDRLKMDAK
ncbi:MAG: AhpC/TSA family protein [Acidobacteria bacterium]|nr:MAG: AhpC/TSA family protein [Acidobacteriota bacterium]REK01877.1 MAG: AhpC/TSA family protein [Acidobacteriota bacterium]REK14833.1 MAG: AhpC/TSA family protein [Acidobacteriota bacterium]REK45548.1 MAG: AhpC/TSA family protein [Acidobacteriota bacterium]